jgi:hypothetical protein
MDQKRGIKALLLLFAGLFLATKLLGLHVFTHESDLSSTDQCEICHIVSADLQHAAQAEEAIIALTPLVDLGYTKAEDIGYAFTHSTDTLYVKLFSRPPPMI